MLDSLYVQPAVLERHRAAPLLTERESYLSHCAKQGYKRRSLRKKAWMLFIIVSSIRIGDRSITHEEIRRSARRDCVHFMRHTQSQCDDPLQHTQQLFIHTATSWLDFLGKLEPAVTPETTVSRQVASFEYFMREERGLSEVTIETRCQRVGNFLNTFQPGKDPVGQITISQVDSYLHQQGANGWSRPSLAALASDLRSFFRYAEGQGWCCAGITTSIEAPRLYSDERLPDSIDWIQVQALIESISGADAISIRDRAIVLLLALYGFRRGEVANLKLDDIDWDREVIRITRSKQRRAQCYPLIQPVGDALIRYLREVRPRCEYREVFLAVNPPIRPLSAMSITPMVRWRFAAALGENAGVHTPHTLRHACARHLLADGFSLKQIGDQLGHRSAATTSIYAKIDLTSLRQVAEFDIGWLL